MSSGPIDHSNASLIKSKTERWWFTAPGKYGFLFDLPSREIKPCRLRCCGWLGP
jgi:hypothetical protein